MSAVVRAVRHAALPVLLLPLIAACQSTSAPPALQPAPIASVAATTPGRPVSPRRVPSQNVLRTAPVGNVDKTGARPTAAPDAETLLRQHFASLGEPPFDDPVALKGRKADNVTAILGDPDLVRHDAPAEMWQYAGEGCVLTLILYQKAGSMTVDHVETRDRTKGTPVAGPGCLKALLAERLTAG